MKTTGLVIAAKLRESPNPVCILMNLLTTGEDIGKNTFYLLNILFKNNKEFDIFNLYLVNKSGRWRLTLGNNYTEEDILTEIRESPYVAERMIEKWEEVDKITIKLL